VGMPVMPQPFGFLADESLDVVLEIFWNRQ